MKSLQQCSGWGVFCPVQCPSWVRVFFSFQFVQFTFEVIGVESSSVPFYIPCVRSYSGLGHFSVDGLIEFIYSGYIFSPLVQFTSQNVVIFSIAWSSFCFRRSGSSTSNRSRARWACAGVTLEVKGGQTLVLKDYYHAQFRFIYFFSHRSQMIRIVDRASSEFCWCANHVRQFRLF